MRRNARTVLFALFLLLCVCLCVDAQGSARRGSSGRSGAASSRSAGRRSFGGRSGGRAGASRGTAGGAAQTRSRGGGSPRQTGARAGVNTAARVARGVARTMRPAQTQAGQRQVSGRTSFGTRAAPVPDTRTNAPLGAGARYEARRATGPAAQAAVRDTAIAGPRALDAETAPRVAARARPGLANALADENALPAAYRAREGDRVGVSSRAETSPASDPSSAIESSSSRDLPPNAATAGPRRGGDSVTSAVAEAAEVTPRTRLSGARDADANSVSAENTVGAAFRERDETPDPTQEATKTQMQFTKRGPTSDDTVAAVSDPTGVGETNGDDDFGSSVASADASSARDETPKQTQEAVPTQMQMKEPGPSTTDSSSSVTDPLVDAVASLGSALSATPSSAAIGETAAPISPSTQNPALNPNADPALNPTQDPAPSAVATPDETQQIARPRPEDPRGSAARRDPTPVTADSAPGSFASPTQTSATADPVTAPVDTKEPRADDPSPTQGAGAVDTPPELSSEESETQPVSPDETSGSAEGSTGSGSSDDANENAASQASPASQNPVSPYRAGGTNDKNQGPGSGKSSSKIPFNFGGGRDLGRSYTKRGFQGVPRESECSGGKSATQSQRPESRTEKKWIVRFRDNVTDRYVLGLSQIQAHCLPIVRP